MPSASLFKWRHFEPEIIVCGVRWSLRYALSYRDVEALMLDRGLGIDHTTVFRWVQRYAHELDQRCRPHLKATNDAYRVDETYIKIKKVWHYLYRAVDAEGQTLDILLRPTRDAIAAKKCFRKVLGASHTVTPRVITVDKNAAYPLAVSDVQHEGSLPESCQLRQSKYADKKNKRPFGAPLAAPRQRTWCWRGGAGWGRGAPQECLGGQQVGARRWPHRKARAQPYALPRHGAHRDNGTPRAGVGLGHPVERCLAGAGRRDGGWIYRAFQMTEDFANHLALRDDGDEPQRPLRAQRAAGHIHVEDPLLQPRPTPVRRRGARLQLGETLLT
jgi:transposase-like protein